MGNDSIKRAILESISTDEWLDIDYVNADGVSTSYWAYPKSINKSGVISCMGFHKGGVKDPMSLTIRMDRIKSCSILRGTYHESVSYILSLLEKDKDVAALFKDEDEPRSGDILSYLKDAHLFDCPPYVSSHVLLPGIDEETLVPEDGVELDEQRFRTLVKKLSHENEKENPSFYARELAMSLLSMNDGKNLYVLAYRPLLLDVENKKLIPGKRTHVNYEFVLMEGEIESVRSIEKYLSPEDLPLLEDFDTNKEKIKELLATYNRRLKVDDMPRIYTLERNLKLDLAKEYGSIRELLRSNKVPLPLDLYLNYAVSDRRDHPIKPLVLFDVDRTNLDQLLAINKSVKKDLFYVQGPPGTGKTNTILSVVLTAFYNDTSVLLSSQNNHPMDGVYSSLRRLEKGGRSIPLPILRLGNREAVLEAMHAILEVVDEVRKDTSPLLKDRARNLLEQESRKLSSFLEKYDRKLDLEEKAETIHDLAFKQSVVAAGFYLEQKAKIDKELDKLKDLSEDEALAYLNQDDVLLVEVLWDMTRERIRLLQGEQAKELFIILAMSEKTDEDRNDKVTAFNKWLSIDENLEYLVRSFPIVVTTNYSSSKLGSCSPHFDLTVIDEAGQCPLATSLLPIARGHRLMLVGDIKQLSPIIVLDPRKNEALREKYGIDDPHDYLSNSIYSSFIKLDHASDEMLLRSHYRSDPRIIGFNNWKYYASRLVIKKDEGKKEALYFVDVPGSGNEGKNTSTGEIEPIIKYCATRKGESIGIITPFVNQRELLRSALDAAGLSDIEVGTVHSFQGDEKETILFSSAITGSTYQGSYEWMAKNTELINVATSRARSRLVVFGDKRAIQKLHAKSGLGKEDDFYELSAYVSTKGTYKVSSRSEKTSRALGYKPYATKVETEFKENLDQVLSVLQGISVRKLSVHHNVSIKDVLLPSGQDVDFYFKGHFDFVVYEKDFSREVEYPLVAFEIDGPEHRNDPRRQKSDKAKERLAKEAGLTLVRIPNEYSRRYLLVKETLLSYLHLTSKA